MAKEPYNFVIFQGGGGSGPLVLLWIRPCPVESAMHKNVLKLFGRLIRSDGIEKEITVRQLAMKSSS